MKMAFLAVFLIGAICGAIVLWAFSPREAKIVIKKMAQQTVEVASKPKHEWPDTDPIDKSDPYWEFNNNLSSNGVPYKKAEVSPGRWQWVVNKEAQERERKWQADIADLYSALRTRVLTDEEFDRAKSLGLSLVTRLMVPYYEQEKRRELDEAFLQQYRLREIANRSVH